MENIIKSMGQKAEHIGHDSKEKNLSNCIAREINCKREGMAQLYEITDVFSTYSR